jgi:hypothetical protein
MEKNNCNVSFFCNGDQELFMTRQDFYNYAHECIEALLNDRLALEVIADEADIFHQLDEEIKDMKDTEFAVLDTHCMSIFIYKRADYM